IQAVEEIMARAPTRVLMLTGDPRGRGGRLTFEALRRGALDLMLKPSALAQDVAAQRNLIEKLAGLCRAGRPKTGGVGRLPRTAVFTAGCRPTGIGIVSSTGGPAALAQVLPNLPPEFPVPIVVVQHLPVGFVEGMARWLDSIAALAVKVA